MTVPIELHFHWSDWLSLFGHYLLLSLLSVGGAIGTMADMQRILVEERYWVTASQFNASIAIAQAAPGPNVLFVALLGWNVGMNAGGAATGLFGVLVTMTGILLPSTTITYLFATWGHRNRELKMVRAFKTGMAPLVIALLFSTSWTLSNANSIDGGEQWKMWLASVASGLLIWKTKCHLVLLLAAGALLGWFNYL
jgi:chromate transporter